MNKKCRACGFGENERINIPKGVETFFCKVCFNERILKEGCCIRCGKKEGVFKTMDPYQHEIYDDEKEYYLCSECYEESLMSI